MATANIIFRQSGDGYSISVSRDDLILSSPITVLNQDNTGVVSWAWSIVDKPTNSAAVLVSATSSTTTFTPDLVGTYLIRLVLNGGTPFDQKGAAIKTANYKYRIPAAKETTEFDASRGWATSTNTAFKLIDDGYASSSGSTTLQSAYNSSNPGSFILNSTNGGFKIHDASTPIGSNLFEVDAYGNGTKYLTISSTASTFIGQILQTGGTVGIGTASPTSMLHVVGTGHFTGNVLLDSGFTSSAQASMGGFKVISVLDPTNPQDAATKNYVDTTAGNLSGTLTPTRIPYITGTHALSDSANLTWNNGSSILNVEGTIIVDGYKIDPGATVPTVGDALVYDGSAFVPTMLGQGVIVYWDLNTTWATVFTQITDIFNAGGGPTVVIDTSYTQTIPSGSYDGAVIRNTVFYAPSFGGGITIDAGATFTGANIILALINVQLTCDGYLTQTNALVNIEMSGVAQIYNNSVTQAVFPQMSGGTGCRLSGGDPNNTGTAFFGTNGAPIFDLQSGATFNMWITDSPGGLTAGLSPRGIVGGDGDLQLKGDGVSLHTIDTTNLAGTTAFTATYPQTYAVTDHTVTGTLKVDGYIINPAGATNGQVLKYNGSSFIPATESVDTFATTYSNTPSNNRITANSTGGPLLIKPTSATQGTLLQVTNSDGYDLLVVNDNGLAKLVGATGHGAELSNFENTAYVYAAPTYLAGYTPTQVYLQSTQADGGGANALTVDTFSAWSNATATLLILANDGATKLSVDTSGTLTAVHHIKFDGYTLDASGGAITNQALVYNGTSFVPTTINSGTVTSVATDSTLTGGTITTSGTLGINLSHANEWTAIQTLDTPVIKNGLTATGSTSNDFSSSTGTFKTSTGAVSLAGNATVLTGKTFSIADMTAGSILFSGSSGLVSQDNGNLFWDSGNHRLGIGTAGPSYMMQLQGSVVSDVLFDLRNTDTSGYSGIRFERADATFEGAIGFGNTAGSLTHLRSVNFHLSNGTTSATNWTFANLTGTKLTLGMSDSSAFIEIVDGSSASTSSASTGRLIYNSSAQHFQISENTGAYVQVGTGISEKGNASNTQVTTTSPTTIVTRTPGAQGNYQINVYYRVATGTTTVTLTIAWTDTAGSQSTTPVSAVSTLVGSYTLQPIYINATTGGAVSVTATTGTSNNLFVSATILEIT